MGAVVMQSFTLTKTNRGGRSGCWGYMDCNPTIVRWQRILQVRLTSHRRLIYGVTYYLTLYGPSETTFQCYHLEKTCFIHYYVMQTCTALSRDYGGMERSRVRDTC